MHKHSTYVHVHVCQQQLDLPLFDLVFLIRVVTVSVDIFNSFYRKNNIELSHHLLTCTQSMEYSQ